MSELYESALTGAEVDAGIALAETALQPEDVGNAAALDVGTTNGTVAAGDHSHSGVYEAADATILKEADVVNALDSTSTTAPLSAAQGKALEDGKLAKTELNNVTNQAQQFRHGFPNRTDTTLAFDNDTHVFTLGVATTATIYINGVPYTLASPGLTIDLDSKTLSSGLWFIWAEVSGGAAVLNAAKSAWDITGLTAIPVATVYWNGAAGAICDERHGADRNLPFHKAWHQTVGARIVNDGSFAQTRPTTSNDGQIELVEGILWDEDIDNEVTTAQGKLVRNWYETDSGVWTWADGTANSGYDRPYIWNSGTSLLQYPKSDSSYTLTDCASNRFIAVWVYASNDTTRPIYVVTPALAATYSTLSNARNATAPVLPFAPELKLLYRWIYRGDGEYQEAADYRTAFTLPSGGVSSPVAAAVQFAPTDTISATNVQAAIEELNTEKSAIKTIRQFIPLDNQPPATAFATLDTRNSVAVLDFDDGATNEAAVFVGVVPEGANLASGIMARIFWTATTATSGDCRWGVQFEKYGTDIDADSFDTATEAHTACSGTSGIAVMTEITCTTIDSLAAGDQFRVKVYRDSSDTSNDTMSGDAELIAVELRGVA